MKQKNNMIFIFTEGGIQYGYGHIMRCSALYDEIERRNVDVQFIVNGNADFEVVLRDKNYIVSEWYEKIEQYGTELDCAIIDSYHVSNEACKTASEHFSKVLFIDDTNRIEYPEGIIVNPALGSEEIPYKRKSGQIYLLGSDYTILRHEFCKVQAKEESIREQVSDILVIMGGSDVCDLTPKIMKLLSNSRYNRIQKHIVVGSGFSNIESIETLNNNENFNLYYNAKASQLRELMLNCDVAITAAGQTVNELIAMRTPLICIKVVDNQEGHIKALRKQGIVNDCYDATYNQSTKNTFSQWLELQIQQNKRPENRKRQVERMETVDLSKGVNQIANVLLQC